MDTDFGDFFSFLLSANKYSKDRPQSCFNKDMKSKNYCLKLSGAQAGITTTSYLSFSLSISNILKLKILKSSHDRNFTVPGLWSKFTQIRYLVNKKIFFVDNNSLKVQSYKNLS